MKISLHFDEDKNLSELYFDNSICTNARLQNFMLNKPFQNWLDSFNTRHIFWKGFIEEISEIFNTRRFDFQYIGSPEDYEQFKILVQEKASEKFILNFEFEKTAEESPNLDSNFIAELISMLKDENSSLARKLRLLQKNADKINLRVIYENYDEVFSVQQMFDLPLKIDTKSDWSGIPTILISEKKFFEDPYRICRIHQVEPTDVLIVAINNGAPEVKLQVAELKRQFEDIAIFLLTGNAKIDAPELNKIWRLYRSYKKKAFRNFILDYPDRFWKDPQLAKNFIAKL